MRLACLVLLMLATACASLTGDIQVATRKYDATNLRSLHTYQWDLSAALGSDTTGTWAPGSLDLGSVLMAAVDRQLQADGYAEVASGADMRVAMLLLGSREQADAARASGDLAYEDATEGSGDADGTLTEGALIIEISHGATGGLIWRGIARSTATRVHDPEEVRRRVDHAVARMFASFLR